MNFPRTQTRTLEQFQADIDGEFIQGSAIAPDLYQVATCIVSDTEILPGGDVAYPIHEALNWRVTRFGKQTRDSLQAILLLNEDGSTWQAKLSTPRFDKDKDKDRKYECVAGGGSRAYLPGLSLKTWRRVAQLHHIPLESPWQRVSQQNQTPSPQTSSANSSIAGRDSSSSLEPTDRERLNYPATPSPIFKGFAATSKTNIRFTALQSWHEWVELSCEALSSALATAPDTLKVPDFWGFLQDHPEIEITFTEGGKKALCLLSHGYVAIALTGVYGGYRKLGIGRVLIPDIVPFCQPGRKIVLAFDQDVKLNTRWRVSLALSQFGRLLTQAECEVSVAQWQPAQGKGIDDLIVGNGIEAWEYAQAQALPLIDWEIEQRLQQRLTSKASLQLKTADLSTLEVQLPEAGILAIDSAKGTGKTKFISAAVADTEKVLAGGHRIALMRNLSERLVLDYKGDLDKAQGEFITGSAYTLRIGFCVDSLLWFDPQKFAGCDLVLDEVVQVIRHLLTSSTCSKEGKRPALLARFKALVRTARRVIVADADLNNDTLYYLQQLRDDNTPTYLIRNLYQNPGYPVRMLNAPDNTIVTRELLQRLETLEADQTIFVCTDNKATSFTLARLIREQSPELRVLVINSKTSGGEAEQAFTKGPDGEVQHYDVVICSPSVATGVSIEIQDRISEVFGVFHGVSSTDTDISQALIRVRQPVPRTVWCAKRGSNFNQVSRSFSAKEVKRHLRSLTTATISLIRCNLREDLVEAWDWDTDPHIDLYCKIAAQQNYAMYHLRDALIVRLRHEGHTVTIEDHESDPTMKLLLRQTRQEIKQMDAEALVNADDLTYSEVAELEQQEGITPEEHLAVAKFHFQEFYGLDVLTIADVQQDNEGRWRGELLNLEAQLFPGLATDRTVRALEKQATWNQGLCPWDISHAELRRQLRSRVGLDELIAKIRSGWKWTKFDLKPYADKARAIAAEIQVGLHLTIDSMSDVQIIHQLLSQLGIKIERHWSRSVEGHEGTKLKVWKLDTDHWQQVEAVLERRRVKRQQMAQKQADAVGSPVGLNDRKQTGDPVPPEQNWLSPEALAEVRVWLQQAETDPARRVEVKNMVPEYVLRHLGALF